MKDSIIKNTGNSRYLKSVENFLSVYPTYESFAAALQAGTFPIDLNGINKAGFQQVGDSLGKANLLKDATAAALGLSADNVPDDALQVLSRLHSRLGNDYLWRKQTISGEIKQATKSSSIGRIGNDVTIYYYDSVQLDLASKKIVGVGEHKIVNQSDTSSQWNRVVGKYMLYPWDADSWPPSTFFKITARTGNDAIFTGYAQYAKFTYGPAQYYNSPNADAYPSGVVDGVQYDELGQIGNKLQIQVGTYVGTGTYYSNKPNSLTFDFVPKLVFVMRNAACFLSDATDGFIYAGQTGSKSAQAFTLTGKTLSWWNYNSAEKQLNASGTTYYYIAVG